MKNLSGINLNLLLTLDALLSEHSVTKAAKKLNLSQSHVSNILNDLRVIFDDKLLVRGHDRQMELTDKAVSLIKPVSEIIHKIEELFVSETAFNPSESSVKFTIGINDFVNSLLIDFMANELHDIAPNIVIDLKHINELNSIKEFIHNGLDLFIGDIEAEEQKLSSMELFVAKPVCLISKNHPLAKSRKISIEHLMDYKLIFIKYRDGGFSLKVKTVIDKYFGDNKLKYNTSHHAMPIVSTLNQSNNICITNSELAKHFAKRFNLRIKNCPIKFSDIHYNMYWKKSDDKNKATIWLRNLISSIIFSKIRKGK